MGFLKKIFQAFLSSFEVVDSDEQFVSSSLYDGLSDEYEIIDNILIPSSGNLPTTQIDHVIISPYGIFVIETKSHQGWIFGDTKSKYWTQVLYRNRYRFYNPFWQNYAHTRAIESLLGTSLKSRPISLVAFPSADKIAVSDTRNVGTANYVLSRILSFDTKLYSADQVTSLADILSVYINDDASAYRQHINDVKSHLQMQQPK